MANFGGLLDEETLAQLQAFQQPSQEAQEAARRNALMQAGFSMMANNRGLSRGQAFGNALGHGGMAGMDAYQGTIDAAQKRDMQALQMGVGIQKMKKEQEQQSRLNLLSDTVGKALTPQTQERVVGYQFNPNADETNTRFNVGNPSAQGDYVKVAQMLVAKQQSGKTLTPDESMVLEQIRSRLEPVKEQVPVQQDMEATLRNLGTQYGIQDPERGKLLLEASKLFAQKEFKPGSMYGSNPNNAKMIGAKELVELEANREGAKTSASEAAKAPYASPVVIKGAGPNGSDRVIPVVDMPRVSGEISTMSPIVAEGSKDFNKNWITNTYQPVQDSGKNADALLGQVKTLRNIDVNTGWGTEARAGGAAILEGLGIAPANAKIYAANAQKFQQVTSERLLTVLNTAKGPQTEGDADRAKQTYAALKNTPEANAFILDMAEANANRDRMKAAYFQDAYQIAAKDGNYSKIDQEWRKIQRSIWDDPIMRKWVK